MTIAIEGLYAIINRISQTPEELIRLCKQLLRGGADAIQFRNKSVVSQEVIDLAEIFSRLCRRFGVPFIVNDYVDLAKKSNADGIHLGQGDMGVKEARQILGDAILVGVTVSRVDEAQQAVIDGADYLGCGHIYPTTTKHKPYPPIGVSVLEKVVNAVSIPVVAIGGITANSVSSVLATGVAAVSLVSAIERHSDPSWACKEIKDIIVANRDPICR
ncbi:thiamine phosphate synthase [Simkania negevensis]|uniref:Thiamine-phosphate synthase n=1 Tax=Simkania negevensis TaxID=83561 RepID=A0ABS3ARM2_9BACT|nr:thiamine phosphate synthase [Simkania negevensis]